MDVDAREHRLAQAERHFPGTVLQTLVVEGDTVRRGQALAVIASREILNEGADLAQARSRLAVAAAAAERLGKLGEEGIVAGARVDEARAQLEQAKAEVAAKARMLDAVSADGARGTYILTAPIDGVVAVAKLQAGAPVEGANAPYVIDAADSYEIQAQVPERLVGQIKAGMRVQLGDKVRAKVTSVGAVIQPETRSASLKAAVLPGSGVVAGRTAMAAIYAPAPAGAAAVPRTAVTEIDGAEVVLVQSTGGFIIRKVTTAGAAGDRIVILSGVKPGEPVVVAGLSDLKAIALSR